MSYQAIIAKLENIRPAENSDNLNLADCFGKTVVIGKDYQEGDVGIFFDTDGVLSEEFCKNNNLFPVFDENGKKIGGGFFDTKRPRVRAQTFRGNKSYGFYIPIKSLEYTKYDLSKLKVGDQFTELNKHEICSKYINPATLRAKSEKRNKKKKLPVTYCFPEHIETEQFKYHANKINKGDLITVTCKAHGTSNRFSYTYVENNNSIIKFLSKFLPIKTKHLGYLVGTRRVILKEVNNATSFYSNEEFRYKHLNLVKDKLQPGELIFGELVGYTTDGKKIMPDHDTKETKDKEFIKKYGKKIAYTYGCLEGECEFYVYRIAKCDENGNLIDLSWAQIKERCKELGLKHVVEIENSFIFDGDIRTLQDKVNQWTDGDDLIDPSIHREGCVIRVENGSKTPLLLKNKNFYFGLMEGYIKSQEDYVDMEESS